MTDLVNPVFDFKSSLKQNDIMSKILKILKEIPQEQLNEMKTKPSFILYICNLVENTITKKHCTDKKEFVINIISQLVPNLNEPEKKQIGDIINFLWNNKDIKKYSLLSKLGIHALKFLKKQKF